MKRTYSKEFKIQACELVIKDNIALIHYEGDSISPHGFVVNKLQKFKILNNYAPFTFSSTPTHYLHHTKEREYKDAIVPHQ